MKYFALGHLHLHQCVLMVILMQLSCPSTCQIPPVQPLIQCSKISAENCLKDIRDIASSMPLNFVLSGSNPITQMDLNTGTPVHGSNKLGDKCNYMRQALQCVLQHSGPCFQQNLVKFDTDINTASTFLRSFCDAAIHWSRMHCFTNTEMKSCETYYTPMNTRNLNTASYCPTYFSFFTCAKRLIDSRCPISDMAHWPVYFLDKAYDAAWKCGTDVSLYGASTGVSGYNYNANANYNPNYPNPNYGSYNSPNYNTYGTGSVNQIGYNPASGSNYPSQGSAYSNLGYGAGGAGGLINPDRPVGPYGDHQYNNLYPVDNCIEKAHYYITNCENTLLQRQREARYARTAHEQQRKHCCGLYNYQDCLARTAIQYCRDPSPLAVDKLMGQRKRELETSCYDHPRAYCNSALKLATISNAIVTCIVFVAFSTYSRLIN